MSSTPDSFGATPTTTIDGPVTITGPVTIQQNDPTLLVPAGSGPAIAMNQQVTIPTPVGTKLYPAAPAHVQGYVSLLLGLTQITDQRIFFRVRWYADAAGTTQVATNDYYPGATGVIDNVPVVAPYVQFQVTDFSNAANNGGVLSAIPTQGGTPPLYSMAPYLASFTPQRVLIDITGAAAIAAGATANLDAIMCYPRPTLLYVQTGGTITVVAQWAQWATTATFHTIQQWISPANLSAIVLPPMPGPLRLKITNTGGAAVSPNGMLAVYDH